MSEQNAGRIESRIDAVRIQEASCEEAAPEEQQAGQTDLADDQPVPQALTLGLRVVFFERRKHLEARCAPAGARPHSNAVMSDTTSV